MENRQKDWWVKKGWIVALVPVVALAGVGAWLIKAKQDRDSVALQGRLDTAVRSVEALGIALDGDELRERLRVPDEDNAALIFSRLGERFSLDGDIKALWGDSKLAVENCLIFHRSEPAIYEQLSAAAELGGCDFDRDWNLGPLLAVPEPMHVRNMAYYCSYLAVADANNGEYERALDKLTVADKIGVHIGREPIVMNKLLEIVVRSNVLRTAVRIFNEHPSDPGAIDLIVRLGDVLSPLGDITRSLQGEALGGSITINAYTMDEVREISGGFGAPSGSGDSIDLETRQVATALFLERVVELHGIWSKDGRYKNIYSMNKAFEDSIDSDSQPGSDYVRVMFPGNSIFFWSYARIGVGTEMFKHLGTVLTDLYTNPGSFDANFYNQLYKDAISDEKLVVRLDSDGLKFYSRGLDGVDDGGSNVVGYYVRNYDNDDFGFWIPLLQN